MNKKLAVCLVTAGVMAIAGSAVAKNTMEFDHNTALFLEEQQIFNNALTQAQRSHGGTAGHTFIENGRTMWAGAGSTRRILEHHGGIIYDQNGVPIGDRSVQRQENRLTALGVAGGLSMLGGGFLAAKALKGDTSKAMETGFPTVGTGQKMADAMALQKEQDKANDEHV